MTQTTRLRYHLTVAGIDVPSSVTLLQRLVRHKMDQIPDIQIAMLRADTHLRKFDLLELILFFGDFNKGINGWCDLCGKHDNKLDNIHSN